MTYSNDGKPPAPPVRELPSLRVRLPLETYEQLRQVAAHERRTMASMASVLLERAVQTHTEASND